MKNGHVQVADIIFKTIYKQEQDMQLERNHIFI